jgi:ubiquinone/menaquinone biosynthesis C-methylase UbiE
LLEVACGQGSFGVGVASRAGARFVGLDLSAAQLARAGRKAEARRVAAAYVRVRGDAMHLPFASASFDGALCVGGLHQIPDPRAAIREVARVLRPGGVFAGGCLTSGAAAMRPFGMNALTSQGLADRLREAGLRDVTCRQTAPLWALFEARR